MLCDDYHMVLGRPRRAGVGGMLSIHMKLRTIRVDVVEVRFFSAACLLGYSRSRTVSTGHSAWRTTVEAIDQLACSDSGRA
jgi:hypothetical protein